MRLTLAIAFGVLLLARASSLAAASSPPSACRPDAQGKVDFQACVDAAERGSAERSLALINLASRAFLSQDYATAVRLYDEAKPPGDMKLYSDAHFHAFRAVAYSHVGRDAEALEDARTALAIMHDVKLASMPDLPANLASSKGDLEALYPYILPVLGKGKDPGYSAALAEYRALPAIDWISYVNRAGVLNELGDVPGALAANDQALKLAPNEPSVLNNACYILAVAGRAAEALPFCRGAVKAAPTIAAVHDSYATALAALGRCAEANTELAAARRLDPVSITYQRTLKCAAS